MPMRRCADRFVFAPEERARAVLAIIDGARDRLFLSLFRCDDFRILDALAAALRRGVSVSVLLTGRAKGGTRRLDELWRVLEGEGATFCRYADPVVKYHAKYIVADAGPALVASLNFTRKCFATTCDFLLVTHDQSVVNGLARLFAADCRRTDSSRFSCDAPRLVVGPECARWAFTQVLERARRSIRLVDHKVTDPAMLDLLGAKQSSGVDVVVLGREGIGGYVPHGKMLLVDGAVGVIGSVSLSALSLDFRREVAIVVHDRSCLRRMTGTFELLGGRGAARSAL